MHAEEIPADEESAKECLSDEELAEEIPAEEQPFDEGLVDEGSAVEGPAKERSLLMRRLPKMQQQRTEVSSVCMFRRYLLTSKVEN